ncbi:hypothetical protein F0344_29765 [Streptomyces finlayi]|uniref:LPXTG cell wall anchor domain-containing protein n=1 Tax=Streptomyces finlayi TaxID=67296 RepID=A0A7G7BSB6_9ACTN|nr:hypothetical protein F0344_29765 [Streptomyces finlayi]
MAKGSGAGEELAETGGTSNSAYLAVCGVAALAVGAAALFTSVRRRAASAASGARHSR